MEIQDAIKTATLMRKEEVAKRKVITEKLETEATTKRALLDVELAAMKSKRAREDDVASSEKRAKLDDEVKALELRETKIAGQEDLLSRWIERAKTR